MCMEMPAVSNDVPQNPTSSQQAQALRNNNEAQN